MCGHGFRAMARTILDEVLDYPIEVIEMQLAHAVKDANGRAYNRTKYREQRHKMMQHWSDYLDGLQADNVVAVKFEGWIVFLIAEYIHFIVTKCFCNVL